MNKFIISRYVDTRGTKTYIAYYPLREVQYRGEAQVFNSYKDAEQGLKLANSKPRRSAYGYNWKIVNSDGTVAPKSPFVAK